MELGVLNCCSSFFIILIRLCAISPNMQINCIFITKIFQNLFENTWSIEANVGLQDTLVMKGLKLKQTSWNIDYKQYRKHCM